MPLGAAREAFKRRGLSEAEAEPFLLEAIKDKRVKCRGPMSLSGIVREPEATDWEKSLVREYLYSPISILRGGRTEGGAATKVLTRIELDRADVMALCEKIQAAAEPAEQRGRKPHGATRVREILAAYDRMVAAGEVSFEQRGGLTRAAEAIQMEFPDYMVNTIEKLIRETHNQLSTTALNKRMKAENSETDFSVMTGERPAYN
jgi:hypothetical protein